jgi:hypothetical protein
MSLFVSHTSLTYFIMLTFFLRVKRRCRQFDSVPRHYIFPTDQTQLSVLPFTPLASRRHQPGNLFDHTVIPIAPEECFLTIQALVNQL